MIIALSKLPYIILDLKKLAVDLQLMQFNLFE